MRYVTVPKDTKIPTPAGPGAYPFRAFVGEFVLGSARFRTDWAAHFAPTLAIFGDVKEGAVIELTDEQHERLYQCAMAATLPPAFIAGAMPHIHAITLAASVNPTVEQGK